LKLVNKIFV